MCTSLSQNKANQIKDDCVKLLTEDRCSIRHVAQVIGTLVAALSGVQYGMLHYRDLERDKINSLMKANACFDALMVLSESAKNDLIWSTENVTDFCN